MNKKIVDLLRIPVDDNGDILIDYNEARNILETYQEIFPDRNVLMMPANITIWEDIDITTLKYMRNFLDEVIKEKEQEI